MERYLLSVRYQLLRMKRNFLIAFFTLLPTITAFSQQVDPKLEQGDIPAWFTYPEEGEYVGVSPNKIKDPVLKEKASEMIALLSYAFCHERKGMSEADFLEHVENNPNFHSTISQQKSESVSKRPLELEFSIDYNVSKRHVGNDGSVWVSIRPKKGKNKLRLSSNNETTLGTETKGDEIISNMKSKNLVNLQYGKSLLSCAWDMSNLQEGQTAASKNTFALKIEHEGRSEVVGVNEGPSLSNTETWPEKQRKAIEKDALKRMDNNTFRRSDIISMCNDKGLLYAHCLVTLIDYSLEDYPQLMTSAIYFNTSGDAIYLVINESFKEEEEPDYEALFAQNTGSDNLIPHQGEDEVKNRNVEETTSDTPSDVDKNIQAKQKLQPKNEIDPVDINIPIPGRVNKNTFAIIIANEDYQSETKVEYAKNDGEVFKSYCHKTLGLPEKNVHFVANATLNNIIGELDWLQQVCNAYGGDASVIFYYAGHGIPDEDTGSAYLMPTDGNSRLLRTCFSIHELYETLGKLPAKKVTVLMDACFSGAKRNGGMLASARGVAIKSRASDPKGSMIVLSAAQGNETAYKYEEAKHGLFTYFLLKKLKDSKGDVTMGELSHYIQDQVKRYSIVENGKSQTPTVQTSNNLRSRWESMKFD